MKKPKKPRPAYFVPPRAPEVAEEPVFAPAVDPLTEPPPRETVPPCRSRSAP